MRKAMKVLKPALGIALLAALAWHAEPQRLWQLLSGVDPGWFTAAVAVGLLNNAVSAVRWAAIAGRLGLAAPLQPLLVFYARAMAANAFLPGSPVTGDVVRAWELSRLGNQRRGSALSVFLDRVSGLWVLCVISAAALAWIAIAPPGSGAPRNDAAALYAAALVAAICLPFFPERFSRKWLQRVRVARHAVLRTAGYSLVGQLAAVVAVCLCARAVGIALEFRAAAAAAAAMFIAGALPASVAGFGGREAGAVVALGMLGVPPQAALAISLLYGMTAIVQGGLAAAGFLAKAR